MVFPTGLVKEGRSLRIVGFFESRGWIESVLPSKGANVSEQRWQKFFFDTRFSSPYLGSKLSLASLSNRSLSFYELRIVGLRSRPTISLSLSLSTCAYYASSLTRIESFRDLSHYQAPEYLVSRRAGSFVASSPPPLKPIYHVRVNVEG